MEWVMGFFGRYNILLLLGSLVLNIFVIILLIINIDTSSNLKDRYRRLTGGTDGKQIEGILFEYIDKAEAVHGCLEKIENQLNVLNNRLSFCIQKTGIVRYSAFDNTGSDLSYSVALLDENNDGIIITGIYGRTETVSYAKPVKNGVSNYSLSVEELQALDRAKANALDGLDINVNRKDQQTG